MAFTVLTICSRDHPPILAPGRYPQWRSRFLRYVDTIPNGEALRKCILSGNVGSNKKVTTRSTFNFFNNFSQNGVTIVKQQHKLDEVSYHKLFDILKQYQNEVNEFRAEKLARNANPLALNLALIAKYFKKIYKPTNNNLRTSSNSKNKNVDTTPRFKNDNQSGQFGNQRMVNVAAARDNVGSKGVPLQAEQYAWLANTDEEVDKQELEAHYSYMAKIQEVPTADSGIDSEPVEQTKQTEFEKYKAFNDRTVDYDKHERKLNEALGQLAHKDTVIREDYEGLVKQKTKVITDLKLREEHDIEKILSMEKQLKFLNEVVYKRSQSIQTIHMMAPRVSTYNGRPTFANPRYPKQAQSEIPCLYAFPYDQNTHANRLILDGEETLALEQESRSKLNKDSMRPYDYTKLNSLYEIFKPPTQDYETYKSRQAYNVMTNNINNFKQIVDDAWFKHSKDLFCALTAHDMEILIQTCLMPLAIKTQSDSLKFVHELKQEMHADLKYVESLEKEIDELESDKAKFLDMYDVILQECVSKDVMCSYLMSLSDLDAIAELQCMYLHKVKECECLAQRLSKQTEFVSKKVHTELLQRFAKVEKHSISLEIALQNCKEQKDIVIGLPKLKYAKDQLCSSCELSKAKRSSFKSKAVLSSKGRLNLLHMDLCGPMRVASINGKKYILVIVDDYSRYTWTLFLHSKDETPEVLKYFLTMIQRNLQASVITVRTDRGTEFLNKTLNAFFKEEGIEHQTSTARTPE
nr:retrovirus-related Pol polyprotein from transposon TNT 1-94 [Tanacetum cinerariifolium]